MMLGNVFILGDSISTFSGWVPEGYLYHYYPSGGSTDIRRVEETWWHQLIAETNSNLVMNNSWSGTTICYTGYEGVDYSAERSFITRFEKLVVEGFFEQNKHSNQEHSEKSRHKSKVYVAGNHTEKRGHKR